MQIHLFLVSYLSKPGYHQCLLRDEIISLKVKLLKLEEFDERYQWHSLHRVKMQIILATSFIDLILGYVRTAIQFKHCDTGPNKLF